MRKGDKSLAQLHRRIVEENSNKLSVINITLIKKLTFIKEAYFITKKIND